MEVLGWQCLCRAGECQHSPLGKGREGLTQAVSLPVHPHTAHTPLEVSGLKAWGFLSLPKAKASGKKLQKVTLKVSPRGIVLRDSRSNELIENISIYRWVLVLPSCAPGLHKGGSKIDKK